VGRDPDPEAGRRRGAGFGKVILVAIELLAEKVDRRGRLIAGRAKAFLIDDTAESGFAQGFDGLE